jgi:hypothetical protein
MPAELITLLHTLAPQSTGLVSIAAVLFYFGRLIKAEGDKRQGQSIARIGERVGKLEQGARLDRAGRLQQRARITQLEDTLRREGVELPPPPLLTDVAADMPADPADTSTTLPPVPAQRRRYSREDTPA